jgi:NAD(P)-dependent dehydrogenase (short-subunit alcohol dehydrogenase family)
MLSRCPGDAPAGTQGTLKCIGRVCDAAAIEPRVQVEESLFRTVRHVVVTGASSGMGWSIALSLSRQGFHVFATVRRHEDGKALQRQATGQLTPLLMDVTDHAEIARAHQAVTAHLGAHGLDALVNNASVGLAWPLEIVPLDRFRAQFEVNVDGHLAVTQTFLPLIRRSTGRVIMIGSVADRLTPPSIGPLAASKHALLAVTEALRLGIAPWNIRVVLVEPGNIHTAADEKVEKDAAIALQHFDPAARELYADTCCNVTSRFGARHKRGSDPHVVAEVVVEAIETPRSRARYLVGKDAWLFAVAGKLAPIVLDSLRRGVFGVPRPARVRPTDPTGHAPGRRSE